MDDSIINLAVGRALSQLRSARPGLTLERLNDAVGISTSQLNGFETGARLMGAPAMWRLCAYFGVGPEAFFVDLAPVSGAGVSEPAHSFDRRDDVAERLADAARGLSESQVEATVSFLQALNPPRRGRGKPRGPRPARNDDFST